MKLLAGNFASVKKCSILFCANIYICNSIRLSAPVGVCVRLCESLSAHMYVQTFKV